jgi:hypothetical protein
VPGAPQVARRAVAPDAVEQDGDLPEAAVSCRLLDRRDDDFSTLADRQWWHFDRFVEG